jgi:hypothetical protein
MAAVCGGSIHNVGEGIMMEAAFSVGIRGWIAGMVVWVGEPGAEGSVPTPSVDRMVGDAVESKGEMGRVGAGVVPPGAESVNSNLDCERHLANPRTNDAVKIPSKIFFGIRVSPNL